MSNAAVGLLFAGWLIVFGLASWRGRRRAFGRDWAAVGALALATLGFFWRPLFTDKAWMPAGGGDLASFIYPMYQFTARHLRDGVLPLWNPYLYGGAPFAADLQSGVLYPVNWLFFLLSGGNVTYRLVEGMAFFHIFLAGATMYLCLRHLDREKLPAGAALTGAVAYMFSDVFLIHLGNLNLIAVAAWLPLVFLFFHRALSRSSAGQAAWAGLFLALAALAGHIQILLFIGLLLAAYAVFWLLAVRPSRRTLPRPRTASYTSPPPADRALPAPDRPAGPLTAITLLVVAALVAGALSAALLLPTLEMSQRTLRADLDYREASAFSLPPAKLIGLFVPAFFERDPALHWGPWDRVEVGYLGVLPLLLAGLALLLRRDRLNLFLLGLTGATLFAAFGGYSIVHGWVYDLLPGFGRLRAPARIVLLTDFALAALAARGLGALMRPLGPGPRAGWRSFDRLAPWLGFGAVLAAAPLTYYSLLIGQEKDPGLFARYAVAANGIILFLVFLLAGLLLLALRRWRWVRPAALGLLAAALVLVDLGSTGAYLDLGRKSPTDGFDHPEIIGFLKSDPSLYRIDTRTDIWDQWQPDTPLLHDIADVWGVVNPLTLADYNRYWENMGSRSSPLYDFLNAKYVIAKKDVTLDWTKFAPVFDRDPNLNVYLNRNALPRAFVVHQATVVADQDAAFAAIHQPGFDPGRAVVVESGRDLGPAPTDRSGVVQVTRYGLNRIEMDVDMPAAGYVILSEVFYPGWEARVDGRVTSVYRADYTFRAVYVEPGRHQVTLTFLPTSFYLGVGAAVAVLLLVLVLAVAKIVRRRSASARSGAD
jgi:hypothetical protein